MKDGLDQLKGRGRRRVRASHVLPPRHPVSGHEGTPSLSIVLEEDDEDTTVPSGPIEVEHDDATAKSDAPVAISTPAAAHDQHTPAAGGHSAVDAPHQSGAAPAGASSRGGGRPAGKPGKARGSSDLPDLSIDWSDPLMHVVKPTRVAIDVSVETRFKAEAAVLSKTELVMAALTTHLADLPALVLARRPDEQGTSEGFFVRRAPASRSELGVPVYLRPKVGEWEALGRIEQWVTGVITAGHPGRRKATKSEIITAALATEYPAAL